MLPEISAKSAKNNSNKSSLFSSLSLFKSSKKKVSSELEIFRNDSNDNNEEENRDELNENENKNALTLEDTKKKDGDSDDEINSIDDVDEAVVSNNKNTVVLSYYDPPMPKFGNHVDVSLLINRNKVAESRLAALMHLVIKDVDESINDAKKIPVGEIDRVVVTEAAAERINAIKSKKDINENIKENTKNMQKALHYRKLGIMMMNSNYSNKLVRKIEPVNYDEARSIVNHNK